jgi:pimeloyl-ACP methyl ester carboxylesterase
VDVILIAGLWLPASIWDRVAVELEASGHRPIALQLPGVDDGSTSATLDDQLAAALAAVDSADRPIVVGHSAASTLAWLVSDRRPADVAAIVLIGGFPGASGSPYAALFDPVDGVMPFPGWERFDDADISDLDDDTRARIESITVAVPETVSHADVELSDDRRFDVPVVLVCPEFSPEDARGWIEAGDIPELQQARQVSYVDIDSGHWPMITRAGELARIIAGIATDV